MGELVEVTLERLFKSALKVGLSVERAREMLLFAGFPEETVEAAQAAVLGEEREIAELLKRFFAVVDGARKAVNEVRVLALGR